MKRLSFAKTSIVTGISTVFKFIAGIVSSKIAAIYIGAQGIALLGNFTNFSSVLLIFAGGAFGTGITKLVAEHEDDGLLQRQVKSISLRYTLILSLVCMVLCIALSTILSDFLFYTTEYAYAVIFFGCCVLFYSLNTYYQAVLNGHKKIGLLAIVNISGSVIGIVLAIVITMSFGFSGAILNPSITQVAIGVVLLLILAISKQISPSKIKGIFTAKNPIIRTKLGKFALMAIVTAVVVPIATYIIRNYVYINFSPDEAGYLQSMWSISTVYLSVIMLTLQTYFLPTLSSLKEKEDIRKELFKGLKYIVPLALVMLTAMFFLRYVVIFILYSEEFYPMEKYFLFQCIGDFFKIASYVFAFLMLAKGMTKWYIISEIAFQAIYVGLSLLLANYFGPVAVTYAYAIMYFLYLVFVVVLFRKIIFLKKKKEVAEITEDSNENNGD